MPKTKENIFKSRIELNYNITYRKVFTVEIYSLTIPEKISIYFN